jgi:NitT/TauT family transport system permease protein
MTRFTYRNMLLFAIFVVGLVGYYLIYFRFYYGEMFGLGVNLVRRFTGLVTQMETWEEVWLSLVRVLVVMGLAYVIAIGTCIVSYLYRPIQKMIQLPLSLALMIPGFVWIIVTIIWLGLGELSVVLSSLFVLVPVFVVAINNSIRQLDGSLEEVAKVYNFNVYTRLRYLVLPQIFIDGVGTIRVGFSIAWKLVIIAELFGVSTGVGFRMNLAYHNYDAVGICIWLAIFIVVVIFLEQFFLVPLEQKISKYLGESDG